MPIGCGAKQRFERHDFASRAECFDLPPKESFGNCRNKRLRRTLTTYAVKDQYECMTARGGHLKGDSPDDGAAERAPSQKR